MTDLFGGYKSQSTIGLQRIDSSKYPDTNKDFEANIRRLNGFVDYISQYLQQMQKGVDQANQDPLTRMRDMITDMGVLLGGGELLYGIDLGDLQYYLPALAAMFGFDSDQPFPINLLYAAEHFLLGYIIPLDSWQFAVEGIIDGWMVALGLDDDFIAAVHLLLENMGRFTGDLLSLFNDVTGLLGIFDIFDFVNGPIGPIWGAFSDLLSNFSVANLGSIADPFLETLTPWINALAELIGYVDDFLETFGLGLDTSGTGGLSNVTNWLSDLLGIFGSPFGLGSGSPTIPGIGSIPLIGGLLNTLGTSFLTSLIPGLDASKIITGLFSQSQVTGLTTIASNLSSTITNLFGGSSVLSQIIAGAVPGLDTSKIITGNFSQSMIINLVSDLGARLLKTVFQGSTRAGSNLMISPTFDDPTITRISYNGAAPGSYSTAQKHSGTHSWTWTNPTPSFWSGLYLAPNEFDYYITASTGDKFYTELWLYAPTGNNHTSGGGLSLGCSFKDSTGVNSDQFSGTSILLSAFTKGAWTKYTHHTSAVPAGYDRVAFNIQNDTGVPAGNVYYVDDVIVREETQEQSILGGLFGSTGVLSTVLAGVIPGLDTSKIITGNFSQSMITNLVSDLGARLLKTMFTNRTTAGSNLVLNPDFEDTTLTMGGSTGNYSTEQSRTGTHSWKFVNANAWEAVEFHNQDTNLYVYNYPEVGVKVQRDQKFYGEVWVRPHASNTKPNPFLNLQITISDSKGVNSPTIVLLQQTTTPLTAGTWTKMSGYGTIPAGYDRGNLSWQVTDTSALGDTYYLDNALFREETAATDIKSQIFGSTGILSTILAAVIPGLNTSKIVSGTFADSLVPGIGTILDNTVNKLFGLAGSGFSQTDAASALQNTASQIASNAASIQALTTTTSGQQNSGRSVTIDFANYSNGSLPAAFTVNYSGAGTSTEGIIDGRVQWTSGTAADRQANNIYNALETFTDYQVAGTSWAYGPENFSGSRQARGRIILRSNLAGTTFVYMDVFTSFFNWYFEIGCVVSGTKTILKSATQFASGYGGVSQMYFAAGTSGGARVFQVYSGTTLVYTHTEVGTTSQFGSGLRYTGFGGDYIGVGGASHPPTVNGFAFADNLPPTYPGSGARITRTSTTQVGVSSGVNLLPTNFFGTTTVVTSDLTVDLVNGSIAVYYSGWYNIKFMAKNGSSAGFPDRIAPVLYINGSANLYDKDIMRGVNSIGGSLVPRWISGEWLSVPLTSGQYVQIGYDASAAASNVLQGEATGLQTYLSVTLANKSYS